MTPSYSGNFDSEWKILKIGQYINNNSINNKLGRNCGTTKALSIFLERF
jgi:hypothetical protein